MVCTGLARGEVSLELWLDSRDIQGWSNRVFRHDGTWCSCTRRPTSCSRDAPRRLARVRARPDAMMSGGAIGTLFVIRLRNSGATALKYTCPSHHSANRQVGDGCMTDFFSVLCVDMYVYVC